MKTENTKVKLPFEHVKIIEDRSQGELNKSIKIDKRCLFVGPTDIQDVEYWEEKLAQRKVPYVLAQFETTVTDNVHGTDELIQRYARGYGIFICQDDLDESENFAA